MSRFPFERENSSENHLPQKAANLRCPCCWGPLWTQYATAKKNSGGFGSTVSVDLKVVATDLFLEVQWLRKEKVCLLKGTNVGSRPSLVWVGGSPIATWPPGGLRPQGFSPVALSGLPALGLSSILAPPLPWSPSLSSVLYLLDPNALSQEETRPRVDWAKVFLTPWISDLHLNIQVCS